MNITRGTIVWVSLLAAVFGCSSPRRWAEEVRVSGTEPPATTAEEAPLPALRMACDVWPPFLDVPGNPRVALELVHAALERAGVQATTSVLDSFDEIVPRLRQGTLDGCPAMWHTEEREQFLHYSRPYLENRLVLIGRKGSDVDAATFAELDGERVGVVASYGYGKGVEEAQGPIFVRGSSEEKNLQSLLQGEVDYVLMDELLVHQLLERHEEKAAQLLQIGTTALVKRSLHLTVRREVPRGDDIIRAFDAQILGMVADGSYHRTLRVGWIRADVDGDGRRELVLAGKHAGLDAPGSSYDLFTPELPETRTDQYHIDGETYESWDRVPSEYKKPPPQSFDQVEGAAHANKDWGVTLFEF